MFIYSFRARRNVPFPTSGHDPKPSVLYASQRQETDTPSEDDVDLLTDHWQWLPRSHPCQRIDASSATGKTGQNRRRSKLRRSSWEIPEGRPPHLKFTNWNLLLLSSGIDLYQDQTKSFRIISQLLHRETAFSGEICWNMLYRIVLRCFLMILLPPLKVKSFSLKNFWGQTYSINFAYWKKCSYLGSSIWFFQFHS